MGKLFRFLIGSMGIAAFSMSVLSCPDPILRDNVDSARDVTPPSIVISSPAEYASYSRIIVVSGSVDDLASSGRGGKVDSLTYEIVSHTAPKSAEVAADGSFRIEEPNDLEENIVLLLKATDWNGNEVEFRLPLTYPGNEIPSFAAAEGNRQVTLSWDAVPGTVSYRLYLEPSAKTPDPATSTVIENVTSPFTLTSLKNASLYSFLLEGTTSDDRQNRSAVVRSIPLSTMHLFPKATEYFNGIELTWRTFSTIQSYEVMRAESPSGPWQSVSGPVAAPPYRDSSVTRGTTYYYAVQPAAYSAVRSEWTEAQADPAASRSDAAVGSYDGIEFANSSVWRDGLLYVADYYHGLRILDVSSPSFPLERGNVAISSARDVYLDGNYAYVTGWKSLYVVDVSVPTAPAIVGSTIISNSSDFQAEGVAYMNNLVFVAGFDEGFAVVDVTDKTAPVVRLSNQDGVLFDQNYEVAVQDRGATKVLVVAGIQYSAIYTVGGSASIPTVTRRYSALAGGNSAAFSGTKLYLASGWNLYAYETSTPTAPSQLGTVELSGYVAAAESVVLSGNRAFVALRDYGYSVVDITTPAGMTVLRIQTVTGEVGHVATGGGYAYVSAGYGYDLQVFGADDPAAAAIVLTKTDLNTGTRIAAYRNYLYVSEYYNSGSGYNDWHAASYNVANPAGAYRYDGDIGSYTPYDFTFAGDRVYAAAERSGIMVWDATNPGSPTVLPPWYVNLPGDNAWSIALTGHYALVGTSGSWLVTVDLSRENTLSVVGSIQTQATSGVSYEARSIAVNGNLAFVANESAGLRVVDIADPAFPLALGGYGALPAGGSAAAVAMAGNFALVADSVNGLMVYDGSTATGWSSAGQARIWPATPSGGGAFDVKVRGNYAYVAKGAAGLAIWDISNPRAPVAAGTVAAAGFSPQRLILYGEYLYAVDGATKLYVLDLVP